MQQPAGAMRQREVSTVIGRQEDKGVARREDERVARQELMQQPASARQRESGRARGQWQGGTTRGNATTSHWDETTRGCRSDRTTKGQEGGTTRGREGGVTGGNATTSRGKTTRGWRGERTREDGVTRGDATTSWRNETMIGQRSDRTMRGQGGGTTWGQEDSAIRVDATTSWSKTTRERRSKRTTRRQYDKRQCNNQPVRWDNKRAVQW